MNKQAIDACIENNQERVYKTIADGKNEEVEKKTCEQRNFEKN